MAAASQVHHQPEQELAIALEQEVGTSTLAGGRFQQEDSEGEESALSREECGTSSDRSGMGCTAVWTALYTVSPTCGVVGIFLCCV